MYARLTKIQRDADGNETVSCVNQGTDACLIHSGVSSCLECPVLAAMMNQLNAFEEIIFSE